MDIFPYPLYNTEQEVIFLPASRVNVDNLPIIHSDKAPVDGCRPATGEPYTRGHDIAVQDLAEDGVAVTVH